jgi:hypothetical protein
VHSYEKELNCGARPALRLITTRDTSAGLHMVLCVSDIIWSQDSVQVGEDGLPGVPHPTLEVTDGWYRLRARVDEILARSVRRGVIRVGRKIAISGASVRLFGFQLDRAVKKNLTFTGSRFHVTWNLAKYLKHTTELSSPFLATELTSRLGMPNSVSSHTLLWLRLIVYPPMVG